MGVVDVMLGLNIMAAVKASWNVTEDEPALFRYRGG